MTARDFVFWFQGWIEMEQPKSISPQRLKMIREHLDLVFQHVAGGPAAEPIDHPTPVGDETPASREGSTKDGSCDGLKGWSGEGNPDARSRFQDELDDAARRVDQKKLKELLDGWQRRAEERVRPYRTPLRPGMIC